MSYAETIDRIRRLAKGDDSCDDELADLLLNSGCYYLLSRSEKQRVKAMSAVAVNSVMINHRYKACSNIFAMLDSIPNAHIKARCYRAELMEIHPTARPATSICLCRQNIQIWQNQS